MSRLADEIARRVETAGLETLDLIGADLTGAAQREAPVEEGTLRGSGDWRVERLPGGGAQVVVSFNTPYAAKQHEELEYDHPQGGKARYLADPFKGRLPRYLDAFRSGMRDAIRGV